MNYNFGVLPQDLVKSGSHNIRGLTFRIALKFDRHRGSSTPEMPVNFGSETIVISSNLVDAKLHEIWR